jgi:peptide/nickel transport system ATP-binding protein
MLVTHNLSVVAHMCDRLAVMNAGRVVEEMSVAELRRGAAGEAYTRQLFNASLGYDRAKARELVTFE